MSEETKGHLTTDVVVVGTGPAGGAAASFLSSYGIKGIIIGMNRSTSPDPRAHICNMAALECLRDIEVEDECRRMGNPIDTMMHTTFGHSMAGTEYGRIFAWGNGPEAAAKYQLSSPCAPIDLPQSELEPILIHKAQRTGFIVRFDTEYLGFQNNQEQDSVDVEVKDVVFQTTFRIRCKYLIGADGARSKLVTQLELPLDRRPGGGWAWNVRIKADLSKHMQFKRGSLHWCYQHDVEHPDFAWIGFPRMVRPWHEWLIVVLPVQGYQPNPPPSQDQWIKRVRQFIGDDTIQFEILQISKWQINNVVAETFSKGRVYCLGDAVHRHPPANGLGSNTCVQDAYNLAWKMAYTLKGMAGPSILESYSHERQPVGRDIVSRAFQSYLNHLPVWEASGILAPDSSTRVAHFSELYEPSSKGRERRKNFIEALRSTRYEYQGIGIEMNQRYRSNAIHLADEEEVSRLQGDPVLDHTRTTYPGARLPHVWLNKRVPQQPVPIMDLTGKGKFTLLTGVGGYAWKDAAAFVGKTLNIPMIAYSIGFGQDYEDSYFEWDRLREVEEDGCILVRPDRFVAWRSMELVKDPRGALLKVVETILSR